MIIVSQLRDGIRCNIRNIHNSVGKLKLKAEKIRIEKEYGTCIKFKESNEGYRLYYDWGNIDIIKVVMENEDG